VLAEFGGRVGCHTGVRPCSHSRPLTGMTAPFPEPSRFPGTPTRARSQHIRREGGPVAETAGRAPGIAVKLLEPVMRNEHVVTSSVRVLSSGQRVPTQVQGSGKTPIRPTRRTGTYESIGSLCCIGVPILYSVLYKLGRERRQDLRFTGEITTDSAAAVCRPAGNALPQLLAAAGKSRPLANR